MQSTEEAPEDMARVEVALQRGQRQESAGDEVAAAGAQAGMPLRLFPARPVSKWVAVLATEWPNQRKAKQGPRLSLAPRKWRPRRVRNASLSKLIRSSLRKYHDASARCKQKQPKMSYAILAESRLVQSTLKLLDTSITFTTSSAVCATLLLVSLHFSKN
eukprot:TRINITY_DN23192_c0_g1_i1.p2 TRINITY_DN23192_c0_g1~~TRINITY_DN23192_c0_g1_i1.p2  ORF type:complete len:160 (-),score=5.73 TRINITY_DN23192_c0_g1_i1:432-911(-)